MNAAELLWVDKYKPSKLDDIVGGNETLKKMIDWVQKWEGVHIKKTIKVSKMCSIYVDSYDSSMRARAHGIFPLSL